MSAVQSRGSETMKKIEAVIKAFSSTMCARRCPKAGVTRPSPSPKSKASAVKRDTPSFTAAQNMSSIFSRR